jgi:hypothetical protein
MIFFCLKQIDGSGNNIRPPKKANHQREGMDIPRP